MMTEFKVLYCLRAELPQISEEFYPAMMSSCVFTSMQKFADYTTRCLQEHHFNIARKCFALAAMFYKDGDPLVRRAVETVFIDALCSFSMYDRKAEMIVQSLIPAHLFGLYVKQKKALTK
jgi:hypothetical protein